MLQNSGTTSGTVVLYDLVLLCWTMYMGTTTYACDFPSAAGVFTCWPRARNYETHVQQIRWPVVWAIEKSDFDQFLSRKWPSSRGGPPSGVLFARRASPCSPFRTLPGAASAVLASSPGTGCFVFQSKLLLPIPHMYSYAYIHLHIKLTCVMLKTELVNR